ncbi:Receptor-like serine/threonine-protein kinase ALE2 [Acorus gramineus]|uniref:Receptor-like serine/threonine-protein kinase ALE2 n=1 Tax=Acorus gramineus TaxID=55184 RepID=A0AAV9A721_ACOGR|nr:Receptor-like serine/threonine-protein kinase ALE2 [Acorus gramineus]
MTPVSPPRPVLPPPPPNLVSELAQEIAAGVFMSQSQVRIMGANAATDQPDKTIVLIDLVPLGQSFDNTTSLLTFEKFWHKQIGIKSSFFGKYEVFYVRYPGLPPSPPGPSNINVEDGPFANNNNGRTIQPLGVDKLRPSSFTSTRFATFPCQDIRYGLVGTYTSDKR